MLALAVVIGLWMVVATVVATILGRVATRADSEELGSTRPWDIGTLDQQVPQDK